MLPTFSVILCFALQKLVIGFCIVRLSKSPNYIGIVEVSSLRFTKSISDLEVLKLFLDDL